VEKVKNRFLVNHIQKNLKIQKNSVTFCTNTWMRKILIYYMSSIQIDKISGIRPDFLKNIQQIRYPAG
jgi:hypothetical protein